MKFAIGLALLASTLLPAAVLAGANRDRGQDEVGPGPDEGPSYFGVVLGTAGKPVDDARVSATYRDGLAMVTRSNAAGAYSLPGFNKRIKVFFDTPGLYVWHCHILSHEDKEMMRPFCVGGRCR